VDGKVVADKLNSDQSYGWPYIEQAPKDDPAYAPGLIRVPEWDSFPWLRAAFSTRLGGATSVYGLPGEQNLGWTAEDDPAIVAGNRRRFVAAAAHTAAPTELVTLLQIHGALTHIIPSRPETPLSTPDGRAVLRGDGAMTQATGLLLGVQTADCVPVLLADTRTRAVAAFHAGWRGTLARIVEHGVARMAQEFGSRPEDLVAAIGPAIRVCCFAVGPEVRAQFEGHFAYAAELFSESGPQIHLDLHAANRRQLLDAGVRSEAVSVIAACSACARVGEGTDARRKFFSHRAEQGRTGRMLSVIGVAAD